jgi:hypothetical protein
MPTGDGRGLSKVSGRSWPHHWPLEVAADRLCHGRFASFVRVFVSWMDFRPDELWNANYFMSERLRCRETPNVRQNFLIYPSPN